MQITFIQKNFIARSIYKIHFDYLIYNLNLYIFLYSFLLSLFKKVDIIELGLLDENFFMYYEDDDLCRRIKQKNKSVIQIFDAKAQHVYGQIKENFY